MVASRSQREKASLSVAVRRSRTSLLKLPIDVLSDDSREQSLPLAVIMLSVALSLSMMGIALLVWKHRHHLQLEKGRSTKAEEQQYVNSSSTSRESETAEHFELQSRGSTNRSQRRYQSLKRTSPVYQNAGRTEEDQNEVYVNARNVSLLTVLIRLKSFRLLSYALFAI